MNINCAELVPLKIILGTYFHQLEWMALDRKLGHHNLREVREPEYRGCPPYQLFRSPVDSLASPSFGFEQVCWKMSQENRTPARSFENRGFEKNEKPSNEESDSTTNDNLSNDNSTSDKFEQQTSFEIWRQEYWERLILIGRLIPTTLDHASDILGEYS